MSVPILRDDNSHAEPSLKGGSQMNEDRIKQFLVDIGIEGADEIYRKSYFSNDFTDRQIYVVENSAIIKTYSRNALESFKLEQYLGSIIEQENIWAPQILGYASYDDEAYLVLDFVTGPVLNDVYQQLSFDDYCSMLSSLGKAMQSFHSVSLNDRLGVPTVKGLSPNHVTESKQRWRDYTVTLETLCDAELVTHIGKTVICSSIDNVSDRAFSTDTVLSHTDIHNENVMFDERNSEQPISIIDWETAAIQPKELDFVHPLLNILGEGFPGRRLANHVVCSSQNEFLRSFEHGYGEKIDWELVICHSILWYLECALESHNESEERSRNFYLKTGLGGLEFIGGTPLDELTYV